MVIRIDDRLRRPVSPSPTRKQGNDEGPSTPDVKRPEGGNELLKRLRKVDPDQAKKYRQRSGE